MAPVEGMVNDPVRSTYGPVLAEAGIKHYLISGLNIHRREPVDARGIVRNRLHFGVVGTKHHVEAEVSRGKDLEIKPLPVHDSPVGYMIDPDLHRLSVRDMRSEL